MGTNPYNYKAVDDVYSDYNEMIPVSPILDHQIDVVTVRMSIEYKDRILRNMNKNITRRKDKAWYEAFLTMYVLLDCLQYLWRGQYLYKLRHKGTVCSSPYGE